MSCCLSDSRTLLSITYTMFRGSVKITGYPLHSPVSPSLPLPCVTVCHHVSTGLYNVMHFVLDSLPRTQAHTNYGISQPWINPWVFIFHKRISSLPSFPAHRLQKHNYVLCSVELDVAMFYRSVNFTCIFWTSRFWVSRHKTHQTVQMLTFWGSKLKTIYILYIYILLSRLQTISVR